MSILVYGFGYVTVVWGASKLGGVSWWAEFGWARVVSGVVVGKLVGKLVEMYWAGRVNQVGV